MRRDGEAAGIVCAGGLELLSLLRVTSIIVTLELTLEINFLHSSHAEIRA